MPSDTEVYCLGLSTTDGDRRKWCVPSIRFTVVYWELGPEATGKYNIFKRRRRILALTFNDRLKQSALDTNKPQPSRINLHRRCAETK